MPFARLVKISRPRFWIYVFGPYIVGLLAGANSPQQFFSPAALAFVLFFLFPANLLIYGINDIFDYETDALNPKKEGYETLVRPEERRSLVWACLLCCAPFAALLGLTPMAAVWAMVAFLFFSIQYSAPPVRAKSVPFLDAAFNVLYALPGLFGYCLLAGVSPSWPLMAAAWCWTMAMHAYSAVPDIRVDRAAGVPTIATTLNRRGTLVFCMTMYTLSALIAGAVFPWLAAALGAVYLGLMFYSLRQHSEEELLRVYALFPWVNTLAGAALFFAILLSKGWV